MELKEVVNLRKLREDFYERSFSESGCSECPFREVCSESENDYCPVEGMLGLVSLESLEMEDSGSKRDMDLYEMERNGTLTGDFQVEYVEDTRERY